LATIGFKLHSGPSNIFEVPEHTTAGSFTIGDLVKLTSGKAQLETSDQAVWGVALKAATGTADTTIPVQVITPQQVWCAAADTTTTSGHVGAVYGLNIATAGSMSIDIGDTTTTTVRIEALDTRDGASALGRCLIRFDPNALKGF
jgi:hypothetical protein